MKKKLPILIIISLGIIFSFIIIMRMNKSEIKYKEAEFYEQLEEGKVKCQLCPNNCLLKNKQVGLCKVRQNFNGRLYSLVYGRAAAVNLDPIEKKPFFHFFPGEKAFSLGTAGCNLHCLNCQNWDIAQRSPKDIPAIELTPAEIIQKTKASGAKIIAFTYNEPTVGYEYLKDTAKLAKDNNLKTVIVSNGYLNQLPLLELLPYLDAIKIDLKSFNPQTYLKLTGAQLEPVLNTIKTVYQNKKWLEIVYLVVPTYTDKIEEIRDMCRYLKTNLSAEVPIHFSRFFPDYKLLDLPATDENFVKEARKVCLEEGMKYVYTGNMDDPEGSTTYSPIDGQPVIIRRGYTVEKINQSKLSEIKGVFF